MNEPATGLADVAQTDAWLGPWETSADPVYCRDPHGRLLSANLSFARKFGQSLAALPGMDMNHFIHPDDQPAMAAIEKELNRPPHRATCEQRCLTPQGVR